MTVTIGVGESGGFRAEFRRADGLVAPALDRCAHGPRVDRSMLDEFLMYVPDPPPPAGVAARAH